MGGGFCKVQSKRMKKPIVVLLLVIFFSAFNCFNAKEAFNVCKHLSTVFRSLSQFPITIFKSLFYVLIFEMKHIKEDLIKDARGRNLHLERVPSWLYGWKSPWQGRLKGGKLISKGEEELYDLGLKIREKFPSLFDEEYHPNIYTIRVTQVPRALASGVAFGMGLFSGNGSLGTRKHQAFSVISESHASDIMLKFHDCYHNYKVSGVRGVQIQTDLN
ncbi:hypothetical protein Ahy_B10g102665 [Arachis hypogaea]|uniref:Multiple inositol polyphosphate phosphatase 1 n=1 Tax=Arachis hypogaea TaxID=3818 RepID=A0A444X283_ARAHY|nr:hypothetical protein Ahy_B10g102665 [Arachis hypogaea]